MGDYQESTSNMEFTLIGDSIRWDYQPYVQQELDGLANVWGPTENGGTSENVLNHLEEWVLSRKVDVVHVNAGVHDVRRAEGETENAVDLAQYQKNTETILKTILEKTSARLIWAATTPVNGRGNDFHYVDANVLAYNEAAAEIAGRLGVEVNDLYRVIAESGRDRLLMPDGIHLTEEGNRLVGKTIADFIRR